MRATGEASISRMIDCTFNDHSKRTQCVSKEGEDTPATAALVKVLEPPPRSCAAASAARPNWKVVDFKWVSGYTPAGFPWPKPVENSKSCSMRTGRYRGFWGSWSLWLRIPNDDIEAPASLLLHPIIRECRSVNTHALQ